MCDDNNQLRVSATRSEFILREPDGGDALAVRYDTEFAADHRPGKRSDVSNRPWPAHRNTGTLKTMLSGNRTGKADCQSQSVGLDSQSALRIFRLAVLGHDRQDDAAAALRQRRSCSTSRSAMTDSPTTKPGYRALLVHAAGRCWTGGSDAADSQLVHDRDLWRAKRQVHDDGAADHPRGGGRACICRNPATPFGVFIVLAAMSGVGGGAFASSMSNISFFFPKRMQGLALGLNAGLGNAGVSVMQFLIPWAITFGMFGGARRRPAGVRRSSRRSGTKLSSCGYRTPRWCGCRS